MKKFSKIFLVLLTLSLVFGTVFTVAASAATEDCCEMLSVSGATHNRHSTFDSDQSGAHKIVPAFAWASGQKGNVHVTFQIDDNGNKYVNYSAKNKNSTSTSTIEGWVPLSDFSAIANHRSGIVNIGAHDYVVIDFEIGTDKYSYKDSNGVWHAVETFEEIPEEYRPAEPHTALALYNGMSLNINGRGATALTATTCSTETNFSMVYTVQDPATGKWYIGSANTYGAEGANYVELSNEIDVYDHFTYVYKVSRTADSARTTGYKFTFKSYAFVNGEYVTETNHNTGHDSTAPNAIRFFIPEADRTSFCIDNVAINWYGHRGMETESKDGTTVYKYSTVGNVYVSDGYGVDDYITSGDYKTKPLYMCEDVVYGVNYSFVGSPAAATVEHLDGTKVNYSNPISAATHIENGDFVHMYANFVDFTPASADVEEVTFISYDGATLSLSAEAYQFYKLQHTGDRYTIRLADNGIKLKWYGDNKADADIIKEHVLVPFVSPSNDTQNLKIHGGVTYEENTASIRLLTDWMWDKNGDGVGDDTLDAIFKKHTVEDLNKLLESGITEIHIVPVYETRPLAYSLEPVDSEGGAYPPFIVENYDYASFTTFESISTAIAKVGKGEEVNVTLYSNCDMSSTEGITVPAGATVNFDLNGHEVSITGSVFTVSEGSVFNLTSSVEGAHVDAASVVTSSGIDACTVNFDGENVEFKVTNVLNLIGSASDVANPNQIVVNIDGGVYYGGNASNAVLFPISEMDMVINVSGAKIFANSNYKIFSLDKNYNASASINLTDVTVLGDFRGTDAPSVDLIGNWDKSSCKIFIENSLVVGIDLSKSGISLGKYNLINATAIDVDKLSVTKAATVAFASDGVLTTPVSISGLADIEDFEGNLELSLLTFVEGADTAAIPEAFKAIKILPVTWLAPDGSEYAKTYWADGSTVDVSFVSADEFGIDESIAGNGWFKLAYSTWTNAADGEGFVVSDGKDNKFKPKAEKVVEALDVVYVSFGISEYFKYNVYLPTPDVAGYEIVFDSDADSSTGFFDENGNPMTSSVAKNVTINEEAGWTQLTVFIAPDDFESDKITMKYLVNGVLLEKTIEVDIFDYAAKVDAAYTCGSDASRLVYALLTYKLQEYLTVSGDNADSDIIVAVEDHLAGHGNDCECGEVNYTAPADEEVDASAIESIVDSYAYALNFEQSENSFYAYYTFSIYFKPDSDVNEVNTGIGTTLERYETDDYIEYRAHVALSDITNVIELTVITDGGSLNASYSLAKHIEDTNSSLAKTLYVLSEAAKATE